MGIELFDPVGEVPAAAEVQSRFVEVLEGRRIGFVFNHHPAAEPVWAGMQARIRSEWRPAAETCIDKHNVSVPVGRTELERLAGVSDCVVVGVGA